MEHSTTPTRAEIDHILGDTLMHAMDAFYADRTLENERTMYARLIERCSSMAAGAVLPLYTRLTTLEARVAAIIEPTDAN